ncbi:hypothetical protein AB3N04_01225 (plasmid) [Alkalihalophilus sp. As8PL]|uniref:Uncharacterized protein n=1 Tax=Alkalihalophilus sp. As8PL TaxID=3237103 RepID=A0AB39BN63_9BACI
MITFTLSMNTVVVSLLMGSLITVGLIAMYRGGAWDYMKDRD